MAITEKPTALQNDQEKTTLAFEALLNPEPETEDVTEEVEEQTEQLEAQDVDMQEEVEEEVFEESEEEEELELQEESEEEFDEENAEEEVIEEPTLYKIKVDGVEQDVTLDELKNGHLRHADYTRKTQKLADRERQLQTMAQELEQKDAIYAEMLPRLESAINAEIGNEPDWDTLSKDDPFEYVQKKQAWDKKKETLKAAQAEQERIQQEKIVEFQKQRQVMVEQGTQTLLDKIPEWKSPDVAKKEQQAIKDFAMNELELTAEEVDGIIDPRIVIGLRKAWQYGNTEKAVKRKPKEKAKARVGRPGTSNVKRTTSPAKKARQKLAKSGKIQDAAKVFEQII